MANLLSLNGHMSSHLDTIHLKVSTHAYFALLFHSTWSKYKNSKNKFLWHHHFGTLLGSEAWFPPPIIKRCFGKFCLLPASLMTFTEILQLARKYCKLLEIVLYAKKLISAIKGKPSFDFHPLPQKILSIQRQCIHGCYCFAISRVEHQQILLQYT